MSWCRLFMIAMVRGSLIGLLAWPAFAAVDSPQQMVQRLIEGTRAAAAAEDADQLAEARKVRQEMLKLHIQLQGEKHWQTTDARLALAHLDLLEKLSPAQRKEAAEAGRLNGLILSLYSQGKVNEALALAERALAIRRRLFGEEHVLTATSLNNLASLWNAQGKSAESVALHHKVLAVRLKWLGRDHPDTATSYNNIAYGLENQGNYAESESFHRQALAIRRKVLGEEHPDTATSCSNLIVCLYALSKYGEAEQLGRQALAVRRNVLGEEHADTAVSYNNLATCLDALGKQKESEPLHRQALVIRRKISGEWHAETANICSNLAVNLTAQARHAEAEAFHRQALAIRQKVLGERHARTAQSYDSLGACLDAQQKYGEAAQFLRTGLAIREAILPPGHPDLGESYDHIGHNLQLGQGKFAEAEAFFRKALAIWQKLRGEEHYHTAVGYHDLASCMDDQVNWADAAPLHQKALAIIRKVRGEEHLDTAIIYTAVAKHLYFRGKHPEAEPLLSKVLEIRRKLLGDEHTDTIQAYSNLAANRTALGRFAEAADLLHRAAAVFPKDLEEYQPLAAYTYQNLAVLLDRQGKHGEAEKIHRQALAARLRVLGPGHPETIQIYHNLALNLHAQGNSPEAEKLAATAAESFRSARLQVGFTGLDRSAFAAERSPLPLLAALLARRAQPARAWDRLEEDLGRGLLDDINGYQRLSLVERDRLRSLQLKLQGFDGRLAGLTGRTATSREQEMKQLRGERETLQKKLLEFQDELAKKYGPAAGQVYDLARIQANILPSTALIAWLDPKGLATSADPRGDHWLCLVRRTGSPVWVQLAGSGPNGAWIPDDESLPDQTRKALVERQPNWRSLVQKLAAQRLAPIDPHLQGSDGLAPVSHLIMLPSPALAGIPIETLTDHYRISYAPSGTMFAWLQEQRRQWTDRPSLLALGDPIFLPATSPVIEAPADDPVAPVLRSDSFRRLPASRREVEAIADLFAGSGGRVQTLLGVDASEQQLEQLAQQKELEKYRYLHLATHGKADQQRGLASYLALTPDQRPGSTSGKHDGRLTAAQILHGWTLNADLVSLSACESGLGQNQGCEGYLGFAQALFLAGSRSLVLSLWQVDDQATALFMTRFYQNLLGKRPGLSEALAKTAALTEAKSWLRSLTRAEVDRQGASISRSPLESAKRPIAPDNAMKPYEHPHYWAGFILVGDPGSTERSVAASALPAVNPVPAQRRTTSSWPWVAIGVVPVAILAFWVWRRRRLPAAGNS